MARAAGKDPKAATKEADFRFVGGYGWLDFVNTEIVERERVVDLLGNATELVHWLRESGMIGPEEERFALDHWVDTAEGEHLLRHAGELRKTLRGAAESFGEGGTVPPTLVEEVNELLARRLGHHELEPTSEGFEVRFRALPEGPEALLAPVAESAARFLAEAEPTLVKGCGNPGCILFFYDASKNHTRRWCSMSACGNRMKARAHYERVRNKNND